MFFRSPVLLFDKSKRLAVMGPSFSFGGLGFRVWGLGFGVWGLGFGVVLHGFPYYPPLYYPPWVPPIIKVI